MKRVLALVSGLAILGAYLGACSGGTRVGPHNIAVQCVPSQASVTPRSRQWIRVWTSQVLTLRRGMFVGLEVVEPEGYSNLPGFPWSAPTVSTSGVLARTRLCHSAAPATLALAVYYFQAIKTGSTTVTVPLSRSWLHRARSCNPGVVCAPLSDLRVAVTVTGG
jgi:hypothetical protein